MQGKRILYFLMILAAGASNGFARLGENAQALQQRYGPPVSTSSISGYTRCEYEKQSFLIMVYYQNGVSVLETFAKRGLDMDTARQVVTLVAAHSVGSPNATQEQQIRQTAGITYRDEIFWSWTLPTPVDAAFNPMECTVSFFNQPAVYCSVQQALASAPLAGS